MRKGSVASMIEIYFGVMIIMFIFVSSIYFSQQGEVRSNADVIAVNSGFECYNNLNNILKSDKIFDKKTSLHLGESDDDLTNLNKIDQHLLNLNLNFKLSISEDCESFEENCELDDSYTTINHGDLSNKEKVISCSLAISKKVCEEDCVKFLHMELYK
ncbi:MAG: hypothetical protein VW079_01475 [Candidatus Woesearchaeota archaeon]